MILYRITDKRHAADLSGYGASLGGGRWNKKRTALLYTASTVSLATLEILVKIHETQIIGDYSLVVINVDSNTEKLKVKNSELSNKWIQNIEETKEYGTNWVEKKQSLMLEVPSAVVPIDKNILINPAHPDFHKVEIIDMVDYHFDNRLFKTHVF